MSITYVGVVVLVLQQLLPRIGVNIGDDPLTITISVLITIASALIGFYGRYRVGGITVFGTRL